MSSLNLITSPALSSTFSFTSLSNPLSIYEYSLISSIFTQSFFSTLFVFLRRHCNTFLLLSLRSITCSLLFLTFFWDCSFSWVYWIFLSCSLFYSSYWTFSLFSLSFSLTYYS